MLPPTGYRSLKDGTMRPVRFTLWPSRVSSASGATRPGGIRWGHARAFVLVLADDLSAEVDKGFVDICSPSGAGFKIGNVPFTRYGECSRTRYCTVVFQVGLVANENHGYVAVFLYPSYLLAQLGELPKGRF
jgi:hypothetical protein